MHQPLASNMGKINVRKNIWMDVRTYWWSWSGKAEKSIEFWLSKINDDTIHNKIRIIEKLVNYQVYDQPIQYLECLPQDEQDAETLYLLSRCYLGKGDINLALDKINATLQLNQESKYLEHQADCLLELGKWELAIKSLEKALRSSPNRPETLYRLGTIYLYHCDPIEALRCFQGCVRLSPRNPVYWEMKAETHLEMTQFRQAVDSFKKALLYGTKPDLYARLAYCYVKLDDIKKGIKYYNLALKYEPDNYDALCNLGVVYQNQGESLEALNLLERAYDMNCNDPILLNNLGFTLVQLGRSRKAVEVYKKALNCNENNPVILYNLSVCHAEKGNWDDAITLLKRLLQNKPDYSEGWILLGNIYEKVTSYEDAVDCYNKALKLA